jgi:hypothetical protein
MLEDVLEAGEVVDVELQGVVPGFTRWSTIGGLGGIIVALSVPRIFQLSFIVGLLAIVAVMALVFLTIYYLAGRPLAQRCRPATSSPYIAVILTNRRVLVLDRALGSDAPQLAEAAAVEDVSTVRHSTAGLLSPQRLEYVFRATERRHFEFPRSEPVAKFVARFTG